MDILTKYAQEHELGSREMAEKHAQQLIDIVMSFPRSSFEVETSDNAISFDGVKLSYLRDWKNKEIQIMTVEEAKTLDAEYAKMKG